MNYTIFRLQIPYKALQDFSIATEKSFKEEKSEVGMILRGKIEKKFHMILKTLDVDNYEIVKGKGNSVVFEGKMKDKNVLGTLHSHPLFYEDDRYNLPFPTSTDTVNSLKKGRLICGIGFYDWKVEEIYNTFWNPFRADPMETTVTNFDSVSSPFFSPKKQIVMKKINEVWELKNI